VKRVLVVLALLSGTASAGDITGIVFVPQPVRAPVAPDRVMPVAPFVPSGVGETTGAVEVGPDRAATLWLDALDVVQVRKAGAGTIKLARVVGAGKTRATIAEPGVAVADGVTYLAQPPGGGDVWMIWADRATTIRVERPVVRSGRAIWETTQRDLLAWVDTGGPRPAIPVVDGAYGAVLRIDADASTGAAIEALDPAQRTAVRAWRKASIVAELAAIRPFVMPQLRVEPLDTLEGMGAAVTVLGPSVDPEPYHRVEKPRTIEVELEGPGALRVEARALLPAPRGGVSNAAELPDVSIAIASDGAVAARRTVAATYATEQDDSIAPAAFPAKRPLTSREGDTLGERVMVSVPLYPGKHRYHIVLDGGALAVRATVARHRPRMIDAISVDDVDEHLANARVAGSSPAAQLVQALVNARAGKPTVAPAPALPPQLQAAWYAATGDVRNRAAAARSVQAADPAHVWIHTLAIARRLPDGDAVRALYASVPGAPPASLVPDLVALLPRSTPLERVRNWPLAATLSAARTRPADPTVTAAVRARWRAGEWAQLRPALDGRDDDLPASRRWLVEAEAQPLAVPRAWRAGDLVRLEPNRPRTVTATASTLDGSRAALLDVYVTATEPGPAAEPRPVDIIVDGKRMQTLVLAPVERVQIAVTPGAHEVMISGPKSLRGWVSQLPNTPVDAADRARVQSLWPAVVDGAKMKFALPAADLPIEVTLRVAGGLAEPLRVAVKTDVGPATELAITRGARDPRARAVDPISGAVSEEVSFVVWPARGAKTAWIESSDASRIVASIATRRERTTAKRVLPSSKNMITSDLLGRVERASKTLAADPLDGAALASRANDLLDLGEPSLARADLVRLLKLPAANKLASSAAIEEELFARLDESSDLSHVALAKRAEQPVLVGPALAVLVTEKLEGALPAAIAARKELAAGNTLAAAKLLVGAYQATDRWPVALEAVDLLTRVLTDRKTTPPAGLISLTYGLAARTKLAIDTPRIRRALVVSAAQSGWDTLNAVTTSAGHEVVLSTRPILPPAPAVLVREALVAPSWQARTAHTLTAGNAGVLDLALPAAMTLRAQVYCVRVRPDHARADEPCNFNVRVDAGTPKPMTAPFSKATELPIALTAGRHVVEVALASEGDAASVRFVSEREIAGVTDPADAPGVFPVRIERRTKLFTASVASPITTSVQGPATLWIQARALGGASSAEVLATSSAGAPVKASLALVADRDDDARGDGRELRI
jgi:hypothetical protein